MGLQCLFLLSFYLCFYGIPSCAGIDCPIHPKSNDSCEDCNLGLGDQTCFATGRLINAMQALDDGCSKVFLEQQLTRKLCKRDAAMAQNAMIIAFQLFDNQKGAICHPLCDNHFNISAPLKKEGNKPKAWRKNQKGGVNGPECVFFVGECVAFLAFYMLKAGWEIAAIVENLFQGCASIDALVRPKCLVLASEAAGGLSAALATFVPELFCLAECA